MVQPPAKARDLLLPLKADGRIVGTAGCATAGTAIAAATNAGRIALQQGTDSIGMLS